MKNAYVEGTFALSGKLDESSIVTNTHILDAVLNRCNRQIWDSEEWWGLWWNGGFRSYLKEIKLRYCIRHSSRLKIWADELELLNKMLTWVFCNLKQSLTGPLPRSQVFPSSSSQSTTICGKGSNKLIEDNLSQWDQFQEIFAFYSVSPKPKSGNSDCGIEASVIRPEQWALTMLQNPCCMCLCAPFWELKFYL